MSNPQIASLSQWSIITTNTKDYYGRLSQAIQNLPHEDVTRANQMIIQAYIDKKRIFVIWNGWSHATASHFVADLVKTIFGKDPLPGIIQHPCDVECLSDNVPTLTATANDLTDGFDHIFSLPLEAKWSAWDLLLVITWSGNSKNILKAIETARRKWIIVLGFLWFSWGKAKELCDHAVVIESDDYGVIEDMHSSLMHNITNHLKIELAKQSERNDNQMVPTTLIPNTINQAIEG